jgi:hypothetical protein
MTNIKKDREIIKNLHKIDSYESAEEIINAYHRLHNLGHEDLEDFLFEYARTGFENEYLKYTFETHLISCDYCIERLTRYKLLSDAITKYGPIAIARVKSKESVLYSDKIKKRIQSIDLLAILKDDEVIKKISTIEEDFSWSKKFTEQGLYSLIDWEGQIHLQWQNECEQSEGPFLTTLHSPLRPKIKKIRIKAKESQEVKELTILLEQKENGYSLSIECQNNKL